MEGGQIGLGHGGMKSLQAPLAGRKRLRPGQMRNVAVPQTHQMRHRFAHAPVVVAHHGGAARLRVHPVDKHYRHTCIAQQGQEWVFAAGGSQNDAVHALGQHAQHQLLRGLGIAACIGYQREEASFAQAVFNAAQDGWEHGVGNVRQQDAYAVGLAGAQRRSRAVGCVAQALRRTLYPLHHLRADEVATRRVEGTRNAGGVQFQVLGQAREGEGFVVHVLHELCNHLHQPYSNFAIYFIAKVFIN